MRRQPRPPPVKRRIERFAGCPEVVWFAEVDGTHPSRIERALERALRPRDRSSGRRLVRVNGEAELEEACEGSRSKQVRCKRDAVRAASRGCCLGEEPGPQRWNAFGDRTTRSLKQATRARSHGEIGRDPTEDGCGDCGARSEARRGTVSTETSARGPSDGDALSAERRGGSAADDGDEARWRQSGAWESTMGCAETRRPKRRG
jgi:hypothetical protein